MIDMLKKIANWKGWSFFNEFLPFFVMVLVWFWFVPFGQHYDPSLGGMSLSYIEMMLFGTLKFTWFNLWAWIVIRLVFPKIWTSKDKTFKDAFINGTVIDTAKWRKVLFISCLYVALVFLQYLVDRSITLPTL